MDALGLDEAAVDPRFAGYPDRVVNYFDLVPLIEEKFGERPAVYWEQTLEALDVPFSRVNTISDLQKDPQIKWLDIYEPERNGVSQVRPPWRFNGERPRRDSLAPRVGQHTLDLASSVLESEDVQALLDAGTIYADDAVPAGQRHV